MPRTRRRREDAAGHVHALFFMYFCTRLIIVWATSRVQADLREDHPARARRSLRGRSAAPGAEAWIESTRRKAQEQVSRPPQPIIGSARTQILQNFCAELRRASISWLRRPLPWPPPIAHASYRSSMVVCHRLQSVALGPGPESAHRGVQHSAQFCRALLAHPCFHTCCPGRRPESPRWPTCCTRTPHT